MRSRQCLRLLFSALALFLLTVHAQAQNGCVNSPENPTALLALFGFAGAGATAWRSRRRR